MSERDLPEELICAILAICLSIPPQDFFRIPNCKQERGALPTAEISDILTVSRRWYRIGTPLLYSSLPISNAAAAETIIGVLTQYPDVGHATRNIRVEAGAEGNLHAIASLTPKVQKLYIAFDHMSNHAVHALAEALPLWHPNELFLVDMTRFLRLYPFFPYRASMRPDSAIRVVGNTAASYWHDLVRLTLLRSVFSIPDLLVRLAQQQVYLGPDSTAALSSAAILSSQLSSLVTETSLQ